MMSAVNALATISKPIPRRFFEVTSPQRENVKPPKSRMQKVTSQTAMTATVRTISRAV
jgi:hypothetical protein